MIDIHVNDREVIYSGSLVAEKDDVIKLHFSDVVEEEIHELTILICSDIDEDEKRTYVNRTTEPESKTVKIAIVNWTIGDALALHHCKLGVIGRGITYYLSFAMKTIESAIVFSYSIYREPFEPELDWKIVQE